jgi:hypothetical protein
MFPKRNLDPNLCSNLYPLPPSRQEPIPSPLIVPMKLPSADLPAKTPAPVFLSFAETHDLEFSFEGITSQMQLLS